VRTPLQRFWAKVAIDPETGCWLWQGASCPQPTNPANRYGYISAGARRSMLVHRFAYETFRGPIADGLTIDHLCRTTLCANPDHLEPVPHLVNVQRGLLQKHPVTVAAAERHCVRGHWMGETNTYTDSRARTRCRECHAQRMRRFRQRTTRERGELPVREPATTTA